MRKRIENDCICPLSRTLRFRSMNGTSTASELSGGSDCRGGRVAFFGGSFDPPHLGHLAVARAARAALNLDRVLFAPVGAQPLKPEGSTAPFPDRLAMTELAISGEPGFEISLADAPHAAGQPNYTLETLRRLRAELSAHGCLFCLMGADSFAGLRRWRGAAEIPFTASLIIASRPGQQIGDLTCCLPPGLTLESSTVIPPTEAVPPSNIELRTYMLRNPAGETSPFYLLPGLDIEISASDIRAQIRAQMRESSRASAASSISPRVADYIRTHSLYR